MNTFALLAVVLLAAEPSSQRPFDSRPVLPPRDPHPFGAIETRPLWERPTRPDPLTLQQRAEDALDRGTGRIEDDASFELRLLARDRAADDNSTLDDDAFDLRPGPRPRDEFERFRLERDRQQRLDDRRLRLERDAWRQQRLEREADALADVRRRFAEQANRPNHALGAVVDRQALESVERQYRAAVAAAARQHASTAAAIDADRNLTPADRAARRAAADAQLDQQRAAAARRWEERRKEVLGQK